MKLDEAKAISGTPRRDFLTSREMAEFRATMAGLRWPGSRSIRSAEARQVSRDKKEGWA